jgi:hypothetical protein
MNTLNKGIYLFFLPVEMYGDPFLLISAFRISLKYISACNYSCYIDTYFYNLLH